MVHQKTGLSFDDLFSYGVNIDNTEFRTQYIEDAENIYNIKYMNAPDELHVPLYKSLSNVKDILLNKQDYFKEYFNNKFNIEIIFDVTDKDSKTITIDKFGMQRVYDIEYGRIRTPSVLLYRVFDKEHTPHDKFGSSKVHTIGYY